MIKKKDPEKIGSILDSFLTKNGYMDVFLEAEVKRKWGSIVGDSIASISKCDSLRDGVLRVKVSSSSWRHELSYLKQQILKNIRENTQCTSINDILFF